MKVKISGNNDTGFEKITWDDLKPCEKHGKTLECSTFKNRCLEMKIQNACIDLMESKTKEEILKIWSDMDRWHNGFTKIQFWPNPEQYKNSQEFDIANLELVYENEGDIKAMNQCLYDTLRKIAYDVNDHLKIVDNTRKVWVKNLKNDMLNRFYISEVDKKEYQKLEIEAIWDMINQQKKVYQNSFRSLVETELKRIKRGLSLVLESELIQDVFKVPDYAGHEKFDTYHFMNRIIASDISRIILDLETGKFISELPIEKGKPTKSKSGYKFTGKENEYAELFEGLKPFINPTSTLNNFQTVFKGKKLSDITPLKWRNDIVSEPMYLIWAMQNFGLIEKKSRQDYEVFKGSFVDSGGNEFPQKLRVIYHNIQTKIDNDFKYEVDSVLLKFQ